eukprot:scpid62090/ scgid9286/ 
MASSAPATLEVLDANATNRSEPVQSTPAEDGAKKMNTSEPVKSTPAADGVVLQRGDGFRCAKAFWETFFTLPDPLQIALSRVPVINTLVIGWPPFTDDARLLVEKFGTLRAMRTPLEFCYTIRSDFTGLRKLSVVGEETTDDATKVLCEGIFESSFENIPDIMFVQETILVPSHNPNNEPTVKIAWLKITLMANVSRRMKLSTALPCSIV